MHLPNVELAYIEPPKLREYLLVAEHPDNNGKARVFAAIGYTRDNWETLVAAILTMIQNTDALFSSEDGFGARYTVTGTLQGPRGEARIMTAWIVEDGIPRFVSAYPVRERRA